MKTLRISRDALFAAAINSIIGLTFEPERKEEFKMQSFVALTTIMPTKIKNDIDANTCVFIIVVAQLSGHMELEAKALELLKYYRDQKLFLEVVQMDYTKFELSEQLLKSITEMLVSIIHSAGCDSLEKGFEKLDAIQTVLDTL